jgi:hypothetical protein
VVSAPTEAEGGPNPLPEEVPPPSGPLEALEQRSFDEAAGQWLNHNLRTISGYGALVLALLMYAAGIFAIGLFIGLFPCLAPPVEPEMWHIVLAVLIALFSVPTLLLLSVLRSTGVQSKDAEVDSLHTALGSKLIEFLEKLVSKSGH